MVRLVGELTTWMMSPLVVLLNSHSAFDTLIPTQPWLTRSRPCAAVDHSAP
jgi:hypothetical protein